MLEFLALVMLTILVHQLVKTPKLVALVALATRPNTNQKNEKDKLIACPFLFIIFMLKSYFVSI
jgi:hypothetical protein